MYGFGEQDDTTRIVQCDTLVISEITRRYTIMTPIPFLCERSH